MDRTISNVGIPVVAVLCLGVFLAYVLFTTGYESLTCERMAPRSVQCESVHAYLFGLVALPRASFPLQEVRVDSELSDRTPQGGVRFRHTLILQGDSASFVSDSFRSPLSGAAIKKQVQSFISGDGPLILTFQRSTKIAALLRSGILALLLGVVAWGFWDVRWSLKRPETSNPEQSDDA